MINLARLFVTGGGEEKSSDDCFKKKGIDGLKVCHAASNQNSCHQGFLLLYVHTIGESLID